MCTSATTHIIDTTQASDAHYRERRGRQTVLSIVVLSRYFIPYTCACEFNGVFPSFIKLTISREAHFYWMLLGGAYTRNSDGFKAMLNGTTLGSHYYYSL